MFNVKDMYQCSMELPFNFAEDDFWQDCLLSTWKTVSSEAWRKTLKWPQCQLDLSKVAQPPAGDWWFMEGKSIGTSCISRWPLATESKILENPTRQEVFLSCLVLSRLLMACLQQWHARHKDFSFLHRIGSKWVKASRCLGPFTEFTASSLVSSVPFLYFGVITDPLNQGFQSRAFIQNSRSDAICIAIGEKSQAHDLNLKMVDTCPKKMPFKII